LTIVGKGEERNYLEKLAKELGVLDKIMFTGQVSKNRIKSLYGISDIFCFPTLKEAAGNVFLEAMASALPIVTVDYGGPKYICPSEGTFKVQISDIETMVESISKYLHTLITDKDLRVQMGKFNAKHCKEHFDWNVISESILKPFELENI
jgi:glycosyltransferase involved in cell wall biosynthesis